MTIQTFLYVIGADDGPVKIGISNNPVGRLAAIQTGCPFKVSLWFVRALPTRDRAVMHERAIHNDYRSHRTSGEWFDFDVDQGIEAIEIEVDTYEHFEERARNGEFA